MPRPPNLCSLLGIPIELKSSYLNNTFLFHMSGCFLRLSISANFRKRYTRVNCIWNVWLHIITLDAMGNSLPFYLQSTKMPILNPRYCQQGSGSFNETTMLCTGFPTGYISACSVSYCRSHTAWWVSGCLPCSLLGGSPSIYNGPSVRILLSNNLPLYGHLALIEIFLATGRQRRTAGVQERAKHIYFGWCVVVCDRHGGEPLFQRQHLYLRCTFLRLDSTNNAK